MLFRHRTDARPKHGAPAEEPSAPDAAMVHDGAIVETSAPRPAEQTVSPVAPVAPAATPAPPTAPTPAPRPARTGRVFYMSVLNIVAALAVVFLHANGVYHLRPGGHTWISACFIESFFYPAVPVFFMLSGATLLNFTERYSVAEFFRKRATRVLIPFLAWTAIAIAYCSYKGTAGSLAPVHVIDGILHYTYAGNYWFFIPLFSMYMSLPLVTGVAKSRSLLRYAIVMGVLFNAIIPFACGRAGIAFDGTLSPAVVAGPLMYAFMGYYINTYELTRAERWGAYLLGVFGFLSQFLGTMYATGDSSTINSLFKGYYNFPAVFQALAVFVFFRSLPYDRFVPVPVQRVGNNLAKYTFGVYLMQAYFIEWLPKILNVSIFSLKWRLLAPIPIFLMAVGITWVFKRLPVLRRIV